MREFQNKYKGQRIFVIGNGPSLSPQDLDLIQGEYSFGINRVGMIFDKTAWRPTHFLCATFHTRLDKDYLRDVLNTIALGIPSFIGERIHDVIGEGDNIHYIECLHIRNDPKGDWWEDIGNNQVSIFGQSLFGAVRIANYLGFSLIYLLGVDGCYKNTGKAEDESHFDPGYEPKKNRSNAARLKHWQAPRIQASHEMIYRCAQKYGFEIYNASRITEINTYPKVKLQDIL